MKHEQIIHPITVTGRLARKGKAEAKFECILQRIRGEGIRKSEKKIISKDSKE